MSGKIKIGVAQTSVTLGTPNERLAWLARRMPSLADAGVELLLLPELFLSGYHPLRSMKELAEPMEGKSAQTVSELARKHAIAIAYGYPERDGNTFYNSVQCFGPCGSRLVNQRKIQIPAGFEGQIFSAGTALNTFSLGGVKFGVLICYDAELPVFPNRLAGSGVDVLLVPMALGSKWGATFESKIPSRGAENGMYLACANYVGRERQINFLGNSAIIGPDGDVLADAGTKADIIVADVQKRARAPAG